MNPADMPVWQGYGIWMARRARHDAVAWEVRKGATPATALQLHQLTLKVMDVSVKMVG